MFTNLELFLQEKDVYKAKIEELKNSVQSPEELAEKIQEEKEKFKGQVRKYLSSAISAINTNFQCQYSIYKVGKDFDANFHVVETNVKKTRSEVIADMEEFKKQAEGLTLSNSQITKINVAMEVLLTYCDEEEGPVDENRENFLNNSKVIATSIIEKPTQQNVVAPVASQTPEPNFNPYANQPIEMDAGFKNPVSENKTIVDPFAGLYGGGAAPISPDAIPMASPDFVEPKIPESTPTMPAPDMNNNQNSNFGNPAAVFGQGNVINSNPMGYENQMNNYSQTPSYENTQSFQMPMGMDQNYAQNTNYMQNSYGNAPMNNGSYYDNSSMNQNYNTMNLNAIPGMGGSASSNSYSYALNSENMDSRVQAITGQNMDTNSNDSNNNDSQKGKSCITSKILKGVLRIPITSLLFMGLVVLVFWGLEKANLIEEITKTLGKYTIYAAFVLVLFFCLIGAATILDSMAAKTKYVSKHAITSLTIYSGVFYGLMKLVPYLTNEVLTDLVDSKILIEVAFYFLYFIEISYFICTFVWLIGFMRTDKKVIKRKLNLVEIVGALWCVYTLILPAIVKGFQTCGIDIMTDKLDVIYSFDNLEWIVIAASFILSAGILLFSKLEEKKL